MSRSCYSDDFGDEFPGQIHLFRANVERSLRSAHGQARLRELRDALLAMPVKELHADIFVADDRQACALGAWALARTQGDVGAARAMVANPHADLEDTDIAKELALYHWPRLVVLETVYQNDEGAGWRAEDPTRRYQRMLEWVEAQLV